MVKALEPVKLLVFAHTPPPHHGQSYMVQLLLEGLVGETPAKEMSRAGASSQDRPIICYHVNFRLSRGISDIGRARWGKLLFVLRYCLQAIFHRLRHGVTNFYYVPANGSRVALYRDWMVMAFCRPWFRNLIYHWHAAGLGDWLAGQAKPWERWISKRLLGRPRLSLVLGEFNRRDATDFESERIAVVPNGIPDPCPDFSSRLKPRRAARATARRRLLDGGRPDNAERGEAGDGVEIFEVLFLSLCVREKGLFDAVEAVVLANQRLRDSPLRIRLTVAGTFWFEAERLEFEARLRQSDISERESVRYAGFVGGETKRSLFEESDCFCFPTYYPAESFGLVLVEAMAYGLPIATTHWRTIPELFPEDYPGIVSAKAPQSLAAVLLQWMQADYDGSLRAHYLRHFTVEQFRARIKAELRKL